jgi:hypothetical protein
VSVCTNIDYATANPYTLPRSFVGYQAEVTVLATDESGEVGVASSDETNIITYNGPHYTVSMGASGSGSVNGFVTGLETGRSADGNLACPGACGALYPYVPGTSIELIATPMPGFTFLGWNGACTGSATTCSFTLISNEAVTATFTGQATEPAITTPAPALGSGGEPRETSASASVGAPTPEAGGKSLAPTRLPARFLSLHTRRHRIQAVVECQEARPCRLNLALSASTSAGQVMVAQRSFTVAPGRSARIRVAINRKGQRILARRHRLLITAHLTLIAAGRATLIEDGRLMLTA